MKEVDANKLDIKDTWHLIHYLWVRALFKVCVLSNPRVMPLLRWNSHLKTHELKDFKGLIIFFFLSHWLRGRWVKWQYSSKRMTASARLHHRVLRTCYLFRSSYRWIQDTWKKKYVVGCMCIFIKSWAIFMRP